MAIEEQGPLVGSESRNTENISGHRYPSQDKQEEAKVE